MTETSASLPRSIALTVPVRELALACGVFLVDCITLSSPAPRVGSRCLAGLRDRRLRAHPLAAGALGRCALTLLVAVWLANMLAVHRAPALSFAFAFLNLTEAALMVGAFRFLWAYPT